MNRYFALVACLAPLTAAAIPVSGCSSSRSSGTILPPVAGMRVAAGRASLNLRPVYCTIPAYAGSSSPAGSAVTPSAGDCSGSQNAALPTTPPAQDLAVATVVLPVDPKQYTSTPTIRYILGPADLTESAIADATANRDTATGQYSVQLKLTKAGAGRFDAIAAVRFACYQQTPSNPPPCSEEAFELQGLVESAPVFQAASFGGNISITGNFTRAQAAALANELKYNSSNEHYLPLPGVPG